MVSHLEKQGWRTLEADDGESGLELAKKHRPEAIVCDLLLHRTNGFHTCVALRKDLGLLTSSIVAISGRTYASNRQLALESGADEFLSKPFQMSELCNVLDRLRDETTEGSPLAPSENDPARVTFWGVRGSIPVPGPATAIHGGNTSCVELRADGELIVLDCGTGAHPLGAKLIEEFKDRPLALTILITHTHWDHIQGFPFFKPAYEAKNRIEILGYDTASAGLPRVLAGQMESPYFPIDLKELPANISVRQLKDLNFQVGDIGVQAAFMNHPGICMGYRFQTKSGSFAFIPDNEPFAFTAPDATTHPSLAPEALAYARTEENHLLEFVRDVDLLIMDAQYDADEYPHHVGWGHGCVDEAVRTALQGNVKRLMLFHHDPSHDDDKLASMTAHARRMVAASKSSLIVDAATEGTELLLCRDEENGARRHRVPQTATPLGSPPG